MKPYLSTVTGCEHNMNLLSTGLLNIPFKDLGDLQYFSRKPGLTKHTSHLIAILINNKPLFVTSFYCAPYSVREGKRRKREKEAIF